MEQKGKNSKWILHKMYTKWNQTGAQHKIKAHLRTTANTIWINWTTSKKRKLNNDDKRLPSPKLAHTFYRLHRNAQVLSCTTEFLTCWITSSSVQKSTVINKFNIFTGSMY